MFPFSIDQPEFGVERDDVVDRVDGDVIERKL